MQQPEIDVSTLLDGELGHRDTLRVIDRLLDDHELQLFYRQSRQLASALEVGQLAASSGELPDGLWERIEGLVERAESGSVVDARHRFQRPAVWMSAVAAVLIMAVTLVIGLRGSLGQTGAGEPVVTVRLASDSGAMDDQRFVELTAELLRADPKYRLMMDRIVSSVNSSDLASEGSVEGVAPITDRGGEMRLAAASDDSFVPPPAQQQWY